MEVLDSTSTKQVQAGNLLVPGLSALAIGVSTGLLSWAIKTSYNGNTEEFNAWQNYVIEGSIGASIAVMATLSFVFAA